MKNITGALLDARLDGEPISEELFGWMFILTLVGGNESTRTVIAQGMRLLIEHPEQLQYLVDNPDKIANACEEILRYNTAFTSMRRTAMEDVELGGQLIKKGDKVLLHYHTINHDENVFGDDAMEFDVTRGRYRTVSTVNSRGEVTLVGPFRRGGDEGPCRTFPIDADGEIEVALGEVLERFLEEATTP